MLQTLSLDELRNVVSNIIADEKHKVLYCAIPKTGSSSWKFYILDNLGTYPVAQIKHHDFLHRNDIGKYGLQKMEHLNSTVDILYRLENYYKFLVVRHPLERLYSGYVDKLHGSNKYYELQLGTKIVKLFRNKPSNSSLINGDDVTFDEFVKWVILTLNSKNMYKDPHWQTFTSLCHPCAISYDYIAKLEN